MGDLNSLHGKSYMDVPTDDDDDDDFLTVYFQSWRFPIDSSSHGKQLDFCLFVYLYNAINVIESKSYYLVDT